MVDSNGSAITEPGFVMEIAGTNTTCDVNGSCSFTPTMNNTKIIIYYENLVVFDSLVFYTA